VFSRLTHGSGIAIPSGSFQRLRERRRAALPRGRTAAPFEIGGKILRAEKHRPPAANEGQLPAPSERTDSRRALAENSPDFGNGQERRGRHPHVNGAGSLVRTDRRDPHVRHAFRRPWNTSRQESEQNRRERRVLMILWPHASQAISEPSGTENGAPFSKAVSEPSGPDTGAAGVLVSEIRARFSTGTLDGSARLDRARHSGHAHGGKGKTEAGRFVKAASPRVLLPER
jgi:hypothetical protein